MTMKRYALFAGSSYYPSGGWKDFVGSFDTAMEARVPGIVGYSESYDWYHIIDLRTGEEVKP